jgi:Tol biopolymer transport system component
MAIGPPTVTADGSFIDFLSVNVAAGAGPGGTVELSRIPFLGGPRRRVLENIWSPVGWSTDKRRLAFVRFDTKDLSSALVIADADGGAQRVLARRTWPMAFSSSLFSLTPPRPAWSRDDRSIAVAAVGTAGGHVAFVDVESGKETVLPSGGTFAAGLAWLNAGAVVVSQPAAPGTPTQLWQISYPQGSVARITNDLSSYVGADVDAERNLLVTSRSDTRAALWVGDATGADAKEIVASWRAATESISVAWAGDRIVYDANTPRPVVAAVPAGGGTTVDLAEQALAGVATSDGRTIVFMRSAGRDTGLWKKDGEDAAPVQLVSGTAWYPRITGDGKYVLFFSDRSGIISPWMVPIGGGEPREIVRGFAAFNSVDVSPDGRRLLLLSSDSQNHFFFVVCDFPACSNRKTIPFPANFAFREERWTPDGKGIAYLDAGYANLWSVPVDGGKPQQITHFTDRSIAGYAWSPDGTRLAVVRATTTNDVVLFKGLRR